jgi:hypothetical protein
MKLPIIEESYVRIELKIVVNVVKGNGIRNEKGAETCEEIVRIPAGIIAFQSCFVPF